MQVPNINNAAGGYQTHERDGYVPYVTGHPGRRRADSWSSSTGTPTWATPGSGPRAPYYPLEYSTYRVRDGREHDRLRHEPLARRPWTHSSSSSSSTAPWSSSRVTSPSAHPAPCASGSAVAGVVGASAVATYTIARGKSTVADRGIMAGFRVALLGLLVFCLMQPTLILSTVVPQQNFVGILMDDSRSMQLAERRRDAAQRLRRRGVHARRE